MITVEIRIGDENSTVYSISIEDANAKHVLPVLAHAVGTAAARYRSEIAMFGKAADSLRGFMDSLKEDSDG